MLAFVNVRERLTGSCEGSSLGLGLVKKSLQLLFGGGLLLLHQVGVALGDAPAVRFGQRGAGGTAGGGLQVLPVVAASPADGSWLC